MKLCPQIAFIFFLNIGHCTLLKGKEITQLQSETDVMKASIHDLQANFNKLEKQFNQRINIIVKESQAVPNIEMIESRMTAVELKIMQLEQPGTPGSIQRRPAYKRGPSSRGHPGGLTPNRPFQDVNDYFASTSPYST